MGVSCRLKRRGDSMKNLLRMVRGAIVAILVAGAAHAQAPENAPSSASPDCADLPSLAANLERTDKILHDWPDLARYADTNAGVPAPTKCDLRVVFMGDSITDHWVSPEFGGFFPGKPYIDRAITAQTTPQMLLRFSP